MRTSVEAELYQVMRAAGIPENAINLKQLVNVNDLDGNGAIDRSGAHYLEEANLVQFIFQAQLTRVPIEFVNIAAQFILIAKDIKQQQLYDLIQSKAQEGLEAALNDYDTCCKANQSLMLLQPGWVTEDSPEGRIFTYNTLQHLLKAKEPPRIPPHSFSMMALVAAEYCMPLIEQASESWTYELSKLPQEDSELYLIPMRKVLEVGLRFVIFERRGLSDGSDALDDLDQVSRNPMSPKL